MDSGSNPLFRLTGDGRVSVPLPDGAHALGLRDEVCSAMEAFLTEMAHRFEPRFGGLTFDQWDSRWTPEGLLVHGFSHLNRKVGLYKAILGERIMYIGKATEHANGGFRKRLSDYCRPGDSGRKSGSGGKMFEHRGELMIEIIVTGADRAGSQVATCLEDLFVERYKPPWNNLRRGKS